MDPSITKLFWRTHSFTEYIICARYYFRYWENNVDFLTPPHPPEKGYGYCPHKAYILMADINKLNNHR